MHQTRIQSSRNIPKTRCKRPVRPTRRLKTQPQRSISTSCRFQVSKKPSIHQIQHKQFSSSAQNTMIPQKYTAFLEYKHPDIPLSMPEPAWDASVALYDKFFAVDASIELLSDFDRSNLPETSEKVKKLLHRYPDLCEPIDMIVLQKQHVTLSSIKNAFENYADLRSQFAEQLELRQEAHHEWEAATTNNIKDEIDEWQQVLAQADQDMHQIKKLAPEKEEDLLQAVLPFDQDDSRNAILEVRPGTGGDEAALFACNMFHMYEQYCSNNRMKFQVDYIQGMDAAGSKGYKEAIATITGTDTFGFLKFETGVHRVQRIPDTESSGRIHTSTVTVAVMPEATEVDVEIKENDIRIDLFRSSGAGGQHVNTTDSAVRITHIPTGLVVQNQDERSQHRNREKAMKLLRSRILEQRRQKVAEERARLKGSQIGTGDRNERIRTYNFPQNRVTDHRCNVTLGNIDGFMLGEGLDEIREKLSLQERLELLLAEHGPTSEDPLQRLADAANEKKKAKAAAKGNK